MRKSLIFSICILGLSAIAIAGAAISDQSPLHQTEHGAACQKSDRELVRIPGGTFQMGSAEYYEEEGPVRSATVQTFWIDRYDVTNAEFARFVAATRYMTDAERKPNRADYPDIPAEKLVAGGAVFTSPTGVRTMDDPMQWWAFAAGADWRHPEGPNSGIKGRDNYPVVQVSYNDALAYAKWMGRDLPTEAQYEYAARGGLDGKTYAWGDELTPGGKYQANVWQGTFPTENTGAGPVADNDMAVAGMPAGGTPASRVLRATKGGSFLCAPNYCRRYRPAARQPQESGFSAAHLGFRTVSNDDPYRRR